jgi:hypothetical protein
MLTRWRIVFGVIAIGCSSVGAWELPPDNGTMGKDVVAAILSENDFPESSGYTQSIDFID